MANQITGDVTASIRKNFYSIMWRVQRHRTKNIYCFANVGLMNFLLHTYFFGGGEWPSGLRRCSKNQKVPGSNSTRRSAGLRDPTSLRGFRWPSGRKCNTQWLTSGEWGCPLDNGPKWGGKIAVKKKSSKHKK